MVKRAKPSDKAKGEKAVKPSLPRLDYPHIHVVKRSTSGGGYVIGGQGGLKPPQQPPSPPMHSELKSDPALIYSPEAEARRDAFEHDVMTGKLVLKDGKIIEKP